MNVQRKITTRIILFFTAILFMACSHPHISTTSHTTGKNQATGKAPDHLYLYHVSGGEGLTNEDVTGITQDKRGLLWITTKEGLNSYDGTTFQHFYRPEKTSSAGIADNELSDIVDDSTQPVLWIASERNGLTAYDYNHNTFKQYRHKKGDTNSLSDDHITSLHLGHHGRLWITTYEGGIDCLDTRTEKITHFNASTVKGMPEGPVWTVAEDGRGHLYVGHDSQGLTVIDLQQKTATHYTHDDDNDSSLPDDEIRSIHVTHTDIVLLGTGRGLAVFSPSHRSFRTLPTKGGIHPRIYSIVENNGHILAATEQHGVMMAGPKLQRLEGQPLSGPVPNDVAMMAQKSVRCLYTDKSHNIWAGSWAGGLDLISPLPPFFRYLPYSTTQPAATDLTAQGILSVAFDKNGNLWAGTDGAGINRFRQQQRVAIYDKASGAMDNNAVQAVLCDSRGRLWWGIYQGGALCQDATTGAITHPLGPEDKKADVRTFLEDPSYGMLIGTENGLYASGKRHSAIGNNKIRALCVDRHGFLWVGLYDGGIVKCSRQFRTVTTYTADNGQLPNNTVNALLTDHKGRIWAGTDDGLVCFTPSGQTREYLRSDRLANTHIRSIIEDRHGRIWTGTNRGISCICEGRVYNFGTRENIRPGHFMDRAAAMAPDGTIFMGSTDGLCTFDPNVVMQSAILPALHINSIGVLGMEDVETRYLSGSDLKNIRLQHDENNLRIGFNIDNLALTPHFNYAYRVKGLDQSWHVLPSPGTIILRNLPSGHYTLEIRLSTHEKGNGGTVSATPFYIAPPFFRSWAAYLLYAMIVITVVISALRLYRQRLRERSERHIERMQRQKDHELNEERLRFFTNVAHELRTPLTLIIGPLDDLREELADTRSRTNNDRPHTDGPLTDTPTINTPSLLRRLDTIHASTLRLLRLVNQLLEVRRIETNNKKLAVAQISVNKLIRQIVSHFMDLNTNKELQYTIEVEDRILWIDSDIVQTILDNLLGNAIKYTPRGSITVTAKRQDKGGKEWMAIRVTDTGYGIAANALPHIFDRYYQVGGRHQAAGTGIGLALAHTLALLHHGDLTVESIEGKGSSFTLWLPTEDIYTDNEKKKEDTDGNIPPSTEHDSCLGAPAQEEENGLKISDPALSATTHTQPTAPTEAPLILVVEDNTEIRSYIADALSKNCQVLEAANGEEGLQLAGRHLPDLIITDIMMPVMDGITLCKRVKNDVRTSHIPVILLTARDSIADKEEGYDSGADSYLTKPFSARLIRSRVDNLLETRRQLAAHIMRLMTEDNEKNGDNQQEEKTKEVAGEAYDNTPYPQDTNGLSHLDALFLQKLYTEIDNNLSNDSLGIPMLCDRLGMSTSTLYRKIKSLTGISGNMLIRTRRLNHAAEMLRQGATVSEAAYASGFGDLSYFRTCFTHQYGMAPSDFVDHNKN